MSTTAPPSPLLLENGPNKRSSENNPNKRISLTSVCEEKEVNDPAPENELALSSPSNIESTSPESQFNRCTSSPSLTRYHSSECQNSSKKDHCGILYKRRDVFRNQWRPRYFVLDRESGLLSYYVLQNKAGMANSSRGDDDSMTEMHNRNLRHFDIINDNVPRGSIYLPGCRVSINEKLSRSGKYFAFTVSHCYETEQHEGASGNVTHLAALSDAERSIWIQEISMACNPIVQPSEPDSEFLSSMHDDSSTETEDEFFLENVPIDIQKLIKERMKRALQVSREDTRRGNRWKVLCKRRSVTAFQKRVGGGPVLVRSEAFLPFRPDLLLGLLLHVGRRTELEPNARIASRLEIFNPHTFIDYYAYKSNRSFLTARDFCVVSHWRVLHNKSILFLSFTYNDSKYCPHPLDLDHVRANLLLSSYLFQPSDGGGCFAKRLYQVDLNGKVPGNVAGDFNKKQALMLLSLSNCLENDDRLAKPDAPLLTSSDITNETLIKNVVKPLLVQQQVVNDDDSEEEASPDPDHLFSPDLSLQRTPSTDENVLHQHNNQVLYALYTLPCAVIWFISKFFIHLAFPYPGLLCVFSLIIGMGVYFTFISTATIDAVGATASSNQENGSSQHTQRPSKAKHAKPTPSLLLDSITLLSPSLIYLLSDHFYPSSREVLFLLSLFYALRTFVLSHLGPPMTYPDSTPVPLRGHSGLGTGAVTCRFTVDLKGILRFIANKKEDRETAAHHANDAEIAVTHIVVKAVARAISESVAFNGTKVRVPLLFIQGYFHRASIDISVAKGIHRNSAGSNRTTKLTNVDKMGICDIANCLSSRPDKRKEMGDIWHRYLYFRGVFIPLLDAVTATLGFGTGLTRYLFPDCNFGSCVVLTSPNSENSELDIDVMPSGRANAPNVVVVIGGVRVIPRAVSASSINRSTGGGGRPVISMSITMNCPAANVAACRKFAERIQKLMQFPEVCEEVKK